jgi:hypothetical protein
MGERAAEKCCLDHARQPDIGSELPGPHEQAPILAAWDRVPDVDVDGLGHGPGVQKPH